VTRQQRDIAKMINYGIAYGLSAFGLAHRLGLEKSEARTSSSATSPATPR